MEICNLVKQIFLLNLLIEEISKEAEFETQMFYCIKFPEVVF